jgi:isoquinoline 1-oxidoreductase beta subunit
MNAIIQPGKPSVPEVEHLARRNFLKVSAFVGGGLLLSLHMNILAKDAAPAADASHAAFEPNAFISIAADGKVTITVPVIEMGQGTYTSVPMLIAEELDVPMSEVIYRHSPPSDKLYGNALLGGGQITGGSTTTRAMFLPLRKAGATTRAMLVSAAAQTWKVPVDQCTTADGFVLHAASGRKLGYGALAASAAKQPVPADVPLKDPSQFKLIGTSAKRLDTPAKVDGSAQFGIDAVVPGMKLAGIIASPTFGGKVGKVDDSKAKAVKGVREVIVLDDAVAVVADHTGAVRKALALLDINWVEGRNKDFTTAKWGEELAQAAKSPGAVAKNVGDAAKAIAGAPTKFTAVYQQPNLAHATMEPMNCTVRLSKTECEIWTGTQVPTRAQAVAAKLTGLPLDSVKVNNYLLGGGFGRRLETDYVEQAVRVAMQAQTPIKLIWSREEDMQHDVYRPFYYDEMSAALDADGKTVAFSHRIVGSSILARWLPPAFQKGIDSDATEAAEGSYDFANLHIDYVRHEPPAGVPTGFWRGVGPNHNAFVVEGFMDELAGVAKKDPLEFRRSMLGKNPRAKAVLDTVAEKIGYGKTLPKGSGIGLAVLTAWESHAALALEVAVDKDGNVSVKHLVAAVDCGQQINPDGIVAQTQSGIIFGLTAALYGKITIDKGRVQESNFNNYQIVRMNQVPPLDVHLIANHEKPGGMGEIATSLPSPALVNAIFAATGKRLRSLPIDYGQLKSV